MAVQRCWGCGALAHLAVTHRLGRLGAGWAAALNHDTILLWPLALDKMARWGNNSNQVRQMYEYDRGEALCVLLRR